MSAEIVSPEPPPARRRITPPFTEADFLQFDPDASEGELAPFLSGWESSYRYHSPEKVIVVGGRQGRAGEFAREERERRVAQLRERIREAHRKQALAIEQRREQEQRKNDALLGLPRKELAEALTAYDVWALKYQEAQRVLAAAQAKKDDLTTSEAPLAQLKKSLADSNAELEAAAICLERIKAEGQAPSARLQAAIDPANAELVLWRNLERENRTRANLEVLQSFGFDRTALERLRIYNLQDLAACRANVTRLDSIRFDRYGRDTRAQAVDLLGMFEKLETELSTK